MSNIPFQAIRTPSHTFQTIPGERKPERAVIYSGDIHRPWRSALGFPMTAARLAAGQGLVLHCRADEIFPHLERINRLLRSPESLNRACAMLDRLAAATCKKLASRIALMEQPISDDEIAGLLVEIEAGLPEANEQTVAARLARQLLPNHPSQEIAGLSKMLARLHNVMPHLAGVKDCGFKAAVFDQRRHSPSSSSAGHHLTLWAYLLARSKGGQSAVWN